MFSKVAVLNALVSAASAEILWDGRFNDLTSSADLEKWSFSNEVGPYQYYIHGSGNVSDYVNLDSSFKNPADTGSKQGVKITIDETSKWEGQSMLRTELIPQTSAAINKGKVYYHFSIKTAADNAPTATNEHQLAFFESHFTELKYGAAGGSNTSLQWHVGGVAKWATELVADEWHNVAYEIDFDAGSVSFHHSTGSDALTQTAGPFDASTSSNGADWHLGVLRLPGSNDGTGAEDWYFSGVYVESGDLTTSVASAGSSGSDASASSSAAGSSAALSTAAPSSSAAASSAAPTSAAPAPTAAPASSAALVSDVVSSSAVPVSSAAPSSAASSSVAAVSPTPAAGDSVITLTVPGATTFTTVLVTETVDPGSPAPTDAAETSTTVVPTAAASPTGASPSASSGATLPEEFTLQEFIAWFKAETGTN